MYLIGNGRVITRNPSQPFIRNGGVIVNGEIITDIDKTEVLKLKYPQAEFIDADGGIIMPGLVNLHRHLSAIYTRGFPNTEFETNEIDHAYINFRSKFENCLDLRACRLYTMAEAITCIKNGITTIFNYHSSPQQPSGSLMSISSVIREAGIRACLCYGVTNEYGRKHCEDAITENTEFIEYAESLQSHQLKAMFGLSSPSTLSNTILKKCAAKNSSGSGFHINLSEDYIELHASLRKFGIRPIERLRSEGLLGSKTILTISEDISKKDAEIIAETDSAAVIEPERDLYFSPNTVYAYPVKPVHEKSALVGMGGGCITDDMFNGLKAAVVLFKNDSESLTQAENDASKMLFTYNPKIASRFFNIKLGILCPGAAADIIIMDYLPYAPISAENADKHIFYGMSGKHCKTTMAGGKLLMLNRKITFIDEIAMNKEIVDFTKSLWKRLSGTKIHS